MEELQTSFGVTASRFLGSVSHFLSSEVGGTAKLLTASLVVFFLAINPRQHVRSEIQIEDTGEGLVYGSSRYCRSGMTPRCCGS